MNVIGRINARKIVFSYYYQHCFFCKLKQDDIALKEVLFIDGTFFSNESYASERENLITIVDNRLNEDSDFELAYFVKNFFDKRPEQEIDMDYVFKVGNALNAYEADLIKMVDKYTTSFTYYDMDTIDQAIFLLGYVEKKVLNTPKEILLNELIELAKRYADEGAPKLVNGVMHKIIAEEEEGNTK